MSMNRKQRGLAFRGTNFQIAVRQAICMRVLATIKCKYIIVTDFSFYPSFPYNLVKKCLKRFALKYMLFQRVVDGNTVESWRYSTRSVCHATRKRSLILYS